MSGKAERVKLPRVVPSAPMFTPQKFEVAHTKVEITTEHIIVGNTMIYRVGMSPQEVEEAFNRHLLEQRWAGAEELRRGLKALLGVKS